MQLHERLAADCHTLGNMATGILLLHKNASLPWFILVPFTEAIALYQLDEEKRILIEKEWNGLAAWVHQRYQCKRVNVAAIGNMVPQLHLHIIARNEEDPCWPGVVWGQSLPDAEWRAQEVASLQEELQGACNLSLPSDT